MEKQFKIYLVGGGSKCYMICTESGTDTGIRFCQEREGTHVYIGEDRLTGRKYKKLKMPRARYGFATGAHDQAFFNDLIAIGAL